MKKAKSTMKKSERVQSKVSTPQSVQDSRDNYLSSNNRRIRLSTSLLTPVVGIRSIKENTFYFYNRKPVERIVYVGQCFPLLRRIKGSDNELLSLITVDSGQYTVTIKKLKTQVVLQPPYPEYLYPGGHYPHPFENWRLHQLLNN